MIVVSDVEKPSQRDKNWNTMRGDSEYERIMADVHQKLETASISNPSSIN